MSKIILDASALVGLINEEKGADIVEKHLSDAVMSAINISETASILMRNGFRTSEVNTLIDSLIAESIAFNKQQAYVAADLYGICKQHGLSFGDRACLSLGLLKNYPVLTADKAWLKLDIDVNVKLIR